MSLPIEDGSRVIREREIVSVFLACGIYENIAKDIVKNTPELAVMTEKSADVFKSILREVNKFRSIIFLKNVCNLITVIEYIRKRRSSRH
jgi:hypothetical protein